MFDAEFWNRFCKAKIPRKRRPFLVLFWADKKEEKEKTTTIKQIATSLPFLNDSLMTHNDVKILAFQLLIILNVPVMLTLKNFKKI
jgi:hypothetical protein